jgi:hypothetical protein
MFAHNIYRLIFKWLVAWKRNQAKRIKTVIPSMTKPARRFSNQTNMSPIKAVRKGRNIYISEILAQDGDEARIQRSHKVFCSVFTEPFIGFCLECIHEPNEYTALLRYQY